MFPTLELHNIASIRALDNRQFRNRGDGELWSRDLVLESHDGTRLVLALFARSAEALQLPGERSLAEQAFAAEEARVRDMDYTPTLEEAMRHPGAFVAGMTEEMEIHLSLPRELGGEG